MIARTKSVKVEKQFLAEEGASRMELALDVAEGKSAEVYALAYMAFGIVETLPDTMEPVEWFTPSTGDPRLKIVAASDRYASITVRVERFSDAAPVVAEIVRRGFTYEKTEDDSTSRRIKFTRPGSEYLSDRVSLVLYPKHNASECVRVRDYEKDEVIPAYRFVCGDAVPGVEEVAS